MIRFLIFDLDGTLFDTAQGIANAFNRLMKDRGIAPVDTRTVIDHIGSGLKDLIDKLDAATSHRLGNLDQLEKDFHHYYKQNILSDSSIYPGAVDFLKKWPHKIAIVSNKNEEYVRDLVKNTELGKFPWTHLIGGNTLPAKKPDPLPLRHVMGENKISPENSVMIGDGLPDILAANNARVKSVAIGFGYGRLPALMQNGAHASITHYNELAQTLKNLEN